MNTSISTFIQYLRVKKYFSIKKVDEPKSKANILVNTLAPKILTSEEDLKRVRPYLDSLKQAIETNGINNIAVTGSYGSGKSTILKTFQNQNEKKSKFLNISLASFSDNIDDTEIERKIEVSILQQMFYHVKPSVIPDSRFKRIDNISQKKLLIIAFVIVLWILSALTLIKFNFIEKLNPSKWNIDRSIDWITFISTLIFFTGIGLFGKNIYRTLRNSSINKFSLKGEIEIGREIDKSIFNQHLEEILYFFESTEFNIVIVEDVDRFNSTDIFTKLREINILINNSDLIERPIKFIYAIKDEMFKDKSERVKFFDSIIPIIPFINPSNANDQLTKLIAGAQLQGELSSEFTSDIVTFIDDIDMRLLINIFQEYKIYRAILDSDLKQDNLFAIIVYKNMYPADFGELSKRKGFLYSFFNNKNQYTKELTENLQTIVKKNENEISAINSEPDKSVKELRAVYINSLASKMPNFHSFYVNHKEVKLMEALEDENFSEIKSSQNIQFDFYYVYNHSSLQHQIKSSNIKFSDIEKTVSSISYEIREKWIMDKADGKVNLLKAENERIKNSIIELEGLSVKEIFEKTDISKYLDEFNDNYLVRSLLLNGYIDEYYDDYISLFHEVSLTKEDFSFERKVKGGINEKFDYELRKVETVIKRIPHQYFRRESILNYSLLECLLENKKTFEYKLDLFYKGLCNDGEKNFQFITGFINTKPKRLALFINQLCLNYSGLGRYIISKSGCPDDEIRSLFRLIFEYADINDILKFEDQNSLVKYLEQITDFFSYTKTFQNIKTLQKFISEKKLRIYELDLPQDSQRQLYEFIYTNNHYQINEHNILQIISGNKMDINLNELSQSNYSTILKLDLKHLKEYIENNIEIYVSNVMNLIKGNSNESEEAITRIVTNKNVKPESKEKMLHNQNTIIQSLEKIDDLEIKKLLFAQNKIQPSWENVFDYFDAEERDDFDDTLLTFLNNPVNFEALSKQKFKVTSERDEVYIKKMAELLLNGKNFTIDAYSNLLDSLPYTYLKIDFDNFNLEKIDKLLAKNVLSLTTDNYNGLKSYGREISTRLLETHQNKFVISYADFTLDSEDWLLFFKSKKITLESKLNIIQQFDDSKIVNNSSIANIVCDILPIDKAIPLRYEVLEAMFRANTSIQKRIGLLILYFPNLDDGQIKSLIELLGENYSKMFVKQHKPVFPNSKENLELFKKLKDKDLISKYELEDKNRFIRVNAKY